MQDVCDLQLQDSLHPSCRTHPLKYKTCRVNKPSNADLLKRGGRHCRQHTQSRVWTPIPEPSPDSMPSQRKTHGGNGEDPAPYPWESTVSHFTERYCLGMWLSQGHSLQVFEKARFSGGARKIQRTHIQNSGTKQKEGQQNRELYQWVVLTHMSLSTCHAVAMTKHNQLRFSEC